MTTYGHRKSDLSKDCEEGEEGVTHRSRLGSTTRTPYGLGGGRWLETRSRIVADPREIMI